MGFLQQFYSYKKICIQCHNNPDADTIASAFGLYCLFTEKGVEAEIIYGGPFIIKRLSLNYMIEHCHIPIRHVEELPGTDLLLVVDGQYGEGNVETFPAPEVAIVDHHYCVTEQNERTLIRSDYQSCSTLVYELLKEEGYPVEENEALRIAFLYGLFTDTSSYLDLYRKRDMAMKVALSGEYPVLERLTKSNMTVAELLIASEALHNHYFDPEHRFAIVQAISCDQTVLGIIGDFMIQVDVVLVCLTYTMGNGGYQISIRSCDDAIHANELAAFVCSGIGSGGGHLKKAGGRISSKSFREAFGDEDVFQVIYQRMDAFIKSIPRE